MRTVIHRFRTNDSDLLRPRDNARRVVANVLTDKPPRMYVKVNDGPWRKLGRKAAVMERFDDWKGKSFRVGIRREFRIETIVRVQREDVTRYSLANCSPGTELAWSLIKHQFGHEVIFGGAYVWKETSPGEWSDHAWGTAIDASAYEKNDRVTDWIARMARANCLEFDYALGSRNGRVVQVQPDGDVVLSGASSSHKWHVHLSIVDHDGRRPPRTGGVY